MKINIDPTILSKWGGEDLERQLSKKIIYLKVTQ